MKFLCAIAGVSKSGYYNYLKSKGARDIKEMNDIKDRDIVFKAFQRKGYKKGARSIKMVLENDFNTNFNLKKIRRIMKKFDIVCPHRKPNPYKNIAKATKEHSVVPNKLKRNFKQGTPGKVLLTDITYLNDFKGSKIYLSAIKDGSTNEILAYNVSNSLDINIALNTIKILFRKKFKLAESCLIHSDQGFHYTSPKFQNLLKNNGICQSMSRKGNCWDNAPMESFFGHMKDHINLSKVKNLKEVEKIISKFINYYNNYRYQWNLKKMTPVQFRDHLLAS